MVRRAVTVAKAPITSESALSVHEVMFRTLLQTPHRNTDETLSIHLEQFNRDPNFYGHLAVWAVLGGNNAVRDVNEVFTAVMFNSNFSEHREAAYVMLQEFPPYQVDRIAKIFTGWEDRFRFASYEKKDLPESGKFGVTVEKLKNTKTIDLSKVTKLKKNLVKKGLISKDTNEFTSCDYLIKHSGLKHRHYKGELRRAIRAYLRLREREENRSMAEGMLLRAKNSVYRLYFKSNTLPGGSENHWINQYLFKNITEPGSRLDALKKLSSASDPTVQAKLIVDNKIPYTSAIGAVKNITPSVLVALIESMSPQELMQNMSSLTDRGAMNNPDVKKLIEGKIKSISKSSKVRVDALKGAVAAKMATNLSSEVKDALIEVTDKQLKHHGQIKARTAILIDRSSSMSAAIELGKNLCAAVAQSCVGGNPPIVYLFNTVPTPITWSEKDGDITLKSSWDNKLKMINANGGTEPDKTVKVMISNKQVVDQILLITDEEENYAGRFAAELKNYEKQLGIMPNVVIVRLGKLNIMETSCKKADISVDVYNCDKLDNVSIPNIIKLLSRKSILDLVQEILGHNLPSKEDWNKKHNMTSAELKNGLVSTSVS